MLAEVYEVEVQLARDLVVHGCGDADFARLREPFQTRCDVDAVAVQPIVFYHDIAEVNTDAELHPLLGWEGGVSRSGDPLDLDGARLFDI